MSYLAMRASMYFRYGADKRPEITSDSTFAAVVAGERTSTTRFPQWPQWRTWTQLKIGDRIRFHEDRACRGRHVDVTVTGLTYIDLARAEPALIEAWSCAEGWTVEHGRKLGHRMGRGLWIQFTLGGLSESVLPPLTGLRPHPLEAASDLEESA